jgi:hypothetical protein
MDAPPFTAAAGDVGAREAAAAGKLLKIRRMKLAGIGLFDAYGGS